MGDQQGLGVTFNTRIILLVQNLQQILKQEKQPPLTHSSFLSCEFQRANNEDIQEVHDE